jgi:hypothetical protein
MKFSDEHKADNAPSGNYFEEGVHKVKIMLVDFGVTDKKQEYVEFTVTDDEEREAKARMWFTTDKAVNYTFSIIRGIFVHNAPKDKKDTVRGEIDSLPDTDALEKACQMLIGKECWLKVEQNGTYTKSDGTEGKNFNRNIYGYEPPAPDPQNVSIANNGVEDVDMSDTKKPGGKITGF